MEEVTVKRIGTPAEFAQAREVRQQVFQQEHGIARELDFDGLDDAAEQFIVYLKDRPVGTARVVHPTPDSAEIQRVAVLPEHRLQGIGRQIMIFIESQMAAAGIREIILSSEVSIRAFYEKTGYAARGEVYQEVGLPHIEMFKLLPHDA